MAEPGVLTMLLGHFTPGGALLIGLCAGSLLSLFTWFVPGVSRYRARGVRSLHIELGRAGAGQNEERPRTNPGDDAAPPAQGQAQAVPLRWWQVDEVVFDESMGID